MAKTFEDIDHRLGEWIAVQKVFFVARYSASSASVLRLTQSASCPRSPT